MQYIWAWILQDFLIAPPLVFFDSGCPRSMEFAEYLNLCLHLLKLDEHFFGMDCFVHPSYQTILQDSLIWRYQCLWIYISAALGRLFNKWHLEIWATVFPFWILHFHHQFPLGSPCFSNLITSFQKPNEVFSFSIRGSLDDSSFDASFQPYNIEYVIRKTTWCERWRVYGNQ